MAGIILTIAGVLVILAAIAGFIIVYRILAKKKKEIRDSISQLQDPGQYQSATGLREESVWERKSLRKRSCF